MATTDGSPQYEAELTTYSLKTTSAHCIHFDHYVNSTHGDGAPRKI